MDGEQPTNVRGRRYDDIRLQEGWRGGGGMLFGFHYVLQPGREEKRERRGAPPTRMLRRRIVFPHFWRYRRGEIGAMPVPRTTPLYHTGRL